MGDSGQTQIHNLTVSADDGITLTGAIYTSDHTDGSNGDIVFNDKVAIDGTVIIDSDDGAITFNTSIDGEDASGDNLTIDGGTGTITLQVIGANTALNTLNINTDSNSTANLTVPNIGAGSAGVTGAVNIGNSATNQLTLSGTVYKTGTGATDYEAKAGNTILLTGVSPTVTTGGGNLSFSTGNIVLSNDGTTTFTTGTGTGGNITVAGTIDGTNTESEALVIESGSGSVQLQGAIGATQPFTTITINSSGAGTVEVTNIGGGSAGASGATAIGNTATTTLTLDGTVYNTGDTQTYTAASGGGNIDITGAATFTTSTDNIAFNTSGVDLGANVAITTTTGGAGNVTFGGAIEAANAGTETLTIDSGSGNVTFSGAIGLTNALGGLNVNATACLLYTSPSPRD